MAKQACDETLGEVLKADVLRSERIFRVSGADRQLQFTRSWGIDPEATKYIGLLGTGRSCGVCQCCL